MMSVGTMREMPDIMCCGSSFQKALPVATGAGLTASVPPS